MSFYLPDGLRQYFKAIDDRRQGSPKFDTLFDKFYLCLMVGLDVRRLGSSEGLEAQEFIRGFPQEYQSQADLIAGLLIDAELERKGIVAEDRGSIEQEVIRLLDLVSSTRLSPEGETLLNQYAEAGFRIVRDRIMAPASLEDFLVAYGALWGEPSEM